jgi:hypothetical protein
MVKPIFTTDVDLLPSVSIAVDYEDPSGSGSTFDITGLFFIWDTTLWDSATEPWYGLNTAVNYRGGGNIGTVISPYWYMDMDAAAAGVEFDFRAVGVELTYEIGGVL